MAGNISVRFSDVWQHKYDRGVQRGIKRMATDMHRQAVVNAPIAHRGDYTNGQWKHIVAGALRRSGRITGSGYSWYITFGGGQVPYARRREFENNLHPETKYWLKRAGETVSAKSESYFKEIL